MWFDIISYEHHDPWHKRYVFLQLFRPLPMWHFFLFLSLIVKLNLPWTAKWIRKKKYFKAKSCCATNLFSSNSLKTVFQKIKKVCMTYCRIPTPIVSSIFWMGPNLILHLLYFCNIVLETQHFFKYSNYINL
jgi:hypothetical protein